MTANQTNHSFPTCALVLKSCYQQAKTTSHKDIATVLQPSFKSTTGNSFSNGSIDPAFFQATVKGACFNCNKPGHFSRSCPLVKNKNSTLPFQSMPPRGPVHFQAHYPIITPSLLNTTFTRSFHPLNPQGPDLYCPNYNSRLQAKIRARLIEVGAEDPGMEVLQAGVDDVKNLTCESVCDTGASHSLTGDLSSLFSFRHLTSAIPVSVATKQS
ncbi:hypothetical protein O181_016025 [Austropuccinia psidii MF-1]|uniref:CCHC-type domain-containing protein n=1 Tax=Austropuccinia psidii MF-1 TaxID=1389203 RepID=A0A9Q3C501_9BASI|nr:hypothetical protein [Austropuccinia psidii MF-1]